MKNIIFTVALLIIFSCGNKKVENEKVSEVKSEKITFTKDQIALAGIETGVLELKPVSAKIMCKGRVEAMPESRAKISVPMSGYISKILVHNGSLVAKGQAILVLQHPDYIELQKKYLQAKSKFEFLEKDYHRQKSLADQNAGTGKIFEKTKSDYEELKIEISALKLQLKMLNINSENLTSENIKSEITVFSPLTGNVNEVWITLG
jgi:cobalt-zinc-cadmium efflux system membrane fusion protein